MDALFDRQPLTNWERFVASPLLFLTRFVYECPPHTPSTSTNPSPANKTRIVCISDTHNTHDHQPPLPEGDILIHAGDLTNSGTRLKVEDTLSWLESQPHPHKIFIAGNHDKCLQDSDTVQHVLSAYPSLTYLHDSSTYITVRGRSFLIYGAPYTPKHGSGVFQYPRCSSHLYSPTGNPETELESTKIWSRIPPLTDILVTHGPPFGHLDQEGMGCYPLLKALWRVRPKVHVFGHIHASRGVKVVRWDAVYHAYEELCARRRGWVGLLRLVYLTTVAWLWDSPSECGNETVMVNAASVGGLRDDQMRGAIVIDI